MKTSENGLDFIADVEGNKLHSYKDTGGVLTIGVGHTSDEFFTVLPDQQITYDFSMKLLAHDAEQAEAAVNNLVTVPLNQNQFDALVSFVFNLGETQFETSTLLRKLNAGDYAGASKQFPVWNKDKVNGRLVSVSGLTKRRLLEQSMFES